MSGFSEQDVLIIVVTVFAILGLLAEMWRG